MTPKRLQQLIARGETLDVEFKGEETRSLSDKELVETVVCMANRPGGEAGWLFIGVEDDGRVTGARPRHPGGRTDPLLIEALISNRTRPSLACRVQLVELEGLAVITIEIPPSRTPVGTTTGKYLRRAIGGRGRPECLPLHFHEMQALQANRGALDYTALPLPEASWEDLDPLEFERFRRTIRESQGLGDASLLDLPDPELAKVLGAVEANHQVTAVRVLGLLLFGREAALRRFIPTHEVAFQRLSGTQVKVNEFFRWPLLRVMEELLVRFRARVQEEEIVVGMVRVGVPDYSERGFREGVANALLHRDFTRLGAVHVQWRDQQLEISSPGGFPEGVSLQNLLVAPPRPRNPLLADAFKRAGIVERTARGIDTIFHEQLRNGRPPPSYDGTTASDVRLVLPGGEPNLEFVRLVAEESQAGRPLGLEALLLLNALGDGEWLTLEGAARLVQKSEGEALSVLEQLVEQDLVRPHGKGRKYYLSTKTAQRFGKPLSPDTETQAREERVIQYLKQHDKITRRETAQLLRMSSPGARDLLKRLTESGLIEPHGQRRGTYYVLTSKIMDVVHSILDTSNNMDVSAKKEPPP